MEIIGSEFLEESTGWESCKGVGVSFLLSGKKKKDN